MNSAAQTLGAVNDPSSSRDLLILGCCTVSLDLCLKSRRELLSQNCRFQRVSAKPWGKQICSLFFAPFTRWEALGESPLCFWLWKIQEEEGKLKQEAILEAKPRFISDLTKKLLWVVINSNNTEIFSCYYGSFYFKSFTCRSGFGYFGLLQVFYIFSSCKCGIFWYL